MSKITFVGTTLLILGLAGGVILDRGVLIDAKVATNGGVGGVAPLTRLPDGPVSAATFDADQMRSIVREELASAAVRQSDGGRPPPSNPAPVSSASPQEQHQAAIRAEAIIETGQWGDAERSDFRQLLGSMSPEDRERVTQEWIQAIESGSIKPSTHGPWL
jgi:hypothetical protein